MKTFRVYFYISIIVIFSCFIHLWGLNWGTPNWKKSLQVLENTKEMKKFVPRMVELRSKFYTAVRMICTGENIEEAIRETYAHHLKSKQFEELSEEVKLDAMRGYFLGSVNTDEQHNIVGVSNLNPFKLDFNPDTFAWGGLHFYSVGAIFGVAKIMNLLSLNREISYYFFHPNEVAQMYTLARFLCAVFTIGAIILLFFIVRPFLGINVAFLSSIFLALFQVVFLNSRMGKPHAQGMFWTLLGVYFVLKIASNSKMKNYVFSGIAFGLAGGVLVTNLLTIMILYIAEMHRNKFRIPVCLNKKFILGNISFFLSFALTNYYFFTDFAGFLRRRDELAISFGYGHINFGGTVEFLSKFFTLNVHWILLPLLLFGILSLLKSKKEFKSLFFFPLIYFLFNVLMMKHEMVFIICLPFIAICLACGVKYFTQQVDWLKIVGLIYTIGVFAFLLGSIIFYNSFFVRVGSSTHLGEWVNSNIPAYESIGVPKGWFGPGDFPAFRFLKYRLVHFPVNVKEIEKNKHRLPKYVIFVRGYNNIVDSDKFKNLYKEIVFRRKSNAFLNRIFTRKYMPKENDEIGLYSLKKS